MSVISSCKWHERQLECRLVDCFINIKQPSTVGLATEFFSSPSVWDTLTHPHTKTHTHRPLCRVITTLLWLYKMGCKYSQASQLAQLTFSVLSSPFPLVFYFSFSDLFPFVLSVFFLPYVLIQLQSSVFLTVPPVLLHVMIYEKYNHCFSLSLFFSWTYLISLFFFLSSSSIFSF